MPDPREALGEGQRYQRGGRFESALAAYATAAEGAADLDAACRAEALWRQATVYRAMCDWKPALEAARAAAETAEAAGLPEQLAEALNAEAGVYLARGELDEAAPILERVLAITDDERVRGVATQNLGLVAAQRGQPIDAALHFANARLHFQMVGYLFGEATVLTNLAALALDGGDFEKAREASAEAVRIATDCEDQELLGIATLNYAEAMTGVGDLTRAEELASVALGHFSSNGNRLRQVECLRLLGQVGMNRGDRAVALRCYTHAHALAQEIGATIQLRELEDCLASLPPT